MDCQNSAEDQNMVIYGHNMKDGTFFGKLELYLDEVYCTENPIIEMNLWGQITRWRVFSVHIAGDEMVPLKFENSKQFGQYISQMKSSSVFDTGIDVGADDVMLTISTCGAGDSSRILVQAVRIDG
jgi:sortase B